MARKSRYEAYSKAVKQISDRKKVVQKISVLAQLKSLKAQSKK